MNHVTAHWGQISVRPKKCPLGLGFCYHDKMPLCRHYYGTTTQVVEPYSGPVTVLCSAAKEGAK